MIKGLRAAILMTLACAAPAAAEGPRAGKFDYYVLALSWSPSWCETEAAEGGAAPEQCAPERDLGFALHGLWPQFEAGGWPEYCETAERDPTRAQTAAMADIMGSAGTAFYQWKKHGRCSGLAASDYFNRARLALAWVRPPDAIAGRSLRPDEITRAFRAANPALAAEDVIVTCAGGRLSEARVCLTRDLDPRPCAPDVRADACRADRVLEIPPLP